MLKTQTVLLGTVYNKDEEGVPTTSTTKKPNNDYRRHVRSLFRFTYRKDFPAFDPYNITSDAGWGCMLRVSQMLMATAYQRHLCGKDWRRGSSSDIAVLRANTSYCNILRWFMDYPGPPYIYAIHHLVQCGIKYDKLPGEWFGPSTAALVLRDLAKIHRAKYDGTMEVLIAQGDTIYISEAEKLCCDRSMGSSSSSSSSSSDSSSSSSSSSSSQPPPFSEESTATASFSSGARANSFYDPLLNPPPVTLPPWHCSLMVCIPLRLGISSVSPEYIQELQEALRNPYCLGFIGGRENHAIYFVGYQATICQQQQRQPPPQQSHEENSSSNNSTNNSNRHTTTTTSSTTKCTFLGLDPHVVFPVASPPPAIGSGSMFPTKELISQVHVEELDSLDSNRLDPSLSLAFYFRNREEFQRFSEETMRNTIEKQKIAEESKKRGVTKTIVTPLYYVQPIPPPNYFDDDEEEEGVEDVVVDDDDDEGEIQEGVISSSGIGSLSEESTNSGANLNSKTASDDDDDEYVLL